ncbi:SIMPL domain-containing protein [Halosimplex pelagicum]|uniref:SIMPL domain-containing protein n=1 Tax=Halosimplex pelagicum TaxID=869886 RepID=A0A7D5P762_9EURY|nr:SIMPL domain-containing protein [Halosimplex pelagicum]QLH80881.1 SIMPL domain-containing protein [Halosimplex pelagicum]
MDRKLTAVALAGIVLLSSFGVASAAFLGSAQAGNQASTVSVSATGSVTAEPDRAVVDVAATAEADNATAATDRLADTVTTLRDALTDENLSVESVDTTSYSVFQRTDNGTTTYVARQSFAVTTDDTDAAGAVIDTAVANGATEIGGVAFAVSEDRRQELRADAIDEAVDDARAQAEAVADSTDLALGNVRSVSTGDGSGFLVQRAADAGTTVEPSPVSVSATVEITYNATAE